MVAFLGLFVDMVSFVVQGVLEITLQSPAHETVAQKHAPELVRVSMNQADVDDLVREFNALTSTVMARSVPLLTVSELCRMVELDTEIQKYR